MTKMPAISTFFIALMLLPGIVQAQVNPANALHASTEKSFIVASVDVAGSLDESTKKFLKKASGLRVGQTITLPNDPAVAVAIRAIYRLGQFSDVEITHQKPGSGGLKLFIHVTSFPRLNEVRFTGLNKKEERQLHKKVDLLPGLVVRPADIKRNRQIIQEDLREKGHHQSIVEVQELAIGENAIDVLFHVNDGPQFRVQKISIDGNLRLSESSLKKVMDTREQTWWRFWDKARFEEDILQEDLEKMQRYMHQEGFYDARIVKDTVVVNTLDDPGLYVSIDVHEGEPYFIESINWEGNTLFSDDQLTGWLGIKPGDRYNLTKLQENLYGNARGSDVSSRYMNLGYMRFSIEPVIAIAGRDSLSLRLDVLEGQPYTFGEIEITGNHVTNDHVVRRELFSVPGERFSRAAIQESVRRLMQTGYFGDQSIRQGPGISIDDANKEVHLRYEIEEANFPMPQFTGTIGQFGLVLGVKMAYNNFSLQKAFEKNGWHPLPSGDGQQVGLNVQANGKQYQQYSFSFSEPWFRGKPAPIGLSISYTHIGAEAVSSDLRGGFNTFSVRAFHDRRLKWPSSFFNVGTVVEYRAFNNSLYEELPTGRSEELSISQSISHNTTDHPLFPASGSHNRFSVEVGLPVNDFVQYHKWRFQSSWNFPLLKSRRLSFNAGADLGYIGSLNGGEVAFERFVLGGSPLDAQGIASTPVLGTDVVYFRGYPLGAFSSSEDGGVTGHRLLTKYTTELRWMAIQKPQFQVMPYAFFDAANAWNDLQAFNATSLFRSAGFGLRMSLPIVGMVDVVYGRNLDSFAVPDGSNKTGLPGWGLQFSIGQPFNF